MRKTTNYGLSLYDKEDKMNITAEENSLNANMQIIDGILKNKADTSAIPTNVSQLTNDAYYISNKPGLITELVPDTVAGFKAGYYCNYTNGVISYFGNDTVFAVTDYIELSSNCKKVIAHVSSTEDLAGICFYDSTKKFVSGVQTPHSNGEFISFECDIPTGAKYVCVSSRKLHGSYVELVKETDGLLNRINKIEEQLASSSTQTSAISYGYAASNILCIGDSLTAGCFYAGEKLGLDIPKGKPIAQNYPYFLSRMLNCKTSNAATGGYSASDWYSKYINQYNYAEYDTFIIWLGTNYGCTSMPTDDEIASFEPATNVTASTANQALYLIKIIQTIQAVNKSCHMVLCTVFGSKADKVANNEVVTQIATKYGCQLVNMSDLSYSNHPELHAGYNDPHFGKSGNIFIANRLALAINDYIASNPLEGDFGIQMDPMPTLTDNEKVEIVDAVISSLPVYNGEVS